MTFVIKHKQLPYFLTWEGTKDSFEAFKDQINMEMKQNGLDSFTVTIIEDNIYLQQKVDEPTTSKRSERKGPRVGNEVKEKGPRSRGNVVSNPTKRKLSQKPPIRKSGGEDPGKLRTRKVATKRKSPMKKVGKGLDNFVESKTPTAPREKKDA